MNVQKNKLSELSPRKKKIVIVIAVVLAVALAVGFSFLTKLGDKSTNQTSVTTEATIAAKDNNDWSMAILHFGQTQINLPIKYTEFKEITGYYTEEDTELSPFFYTETDLVNDNGNIINVIVSNNTESTANITECDIQSVRVNDVSNFVFPGELYFDKTVTENDIKKALGGNYKKEGNVYKYTGTPDSLSYSLTAEGDKITEIELRNSVN